MLINHFFLINTYPLNAILGLFIDQQKVISDEIKHKYQQINKSSNLKENWQVV